MHDFFPESFGARADGNAKDTAAVQAATMSLDSLMSNATSPRISCHSGLTRTSFTDPIDKLSRCRSSRASITS